MEMDEQMKEKEIKLGERELRAEGIWKSYVFNLHRRDS